MVYYKLRVERVLGIIIILVNESFLNLFLVFQKSRGIDFINYKLKII